MKKLSVALLLVIIVAVCFVVPSFAADGLKVGLVMPSTVNDYAFSQSMYESLLKLQTEYGKDKFEIFYSESLGDATKAETAIRDYADEGCDIIIAHGSQYGTKIQGIAPDYPDTLFAWGNGTDTYGLKNVYVYNAEAQYGGYIFGYIAGMESKTGIVGACGPVESGDAKSYIDGFLNGAIAAGLDEKNVRKTFTGSFGDVSLMNAAAKSHISEGADILTGTSQAVPGAVSAVKEAGKVWMGVQYDTTPLAPEVVMVNLVYNWTPILSEIIADKKAGAPNGHAIALNFANEGLTIVWNDANFKISDEVKAKAESLKKDLVDGKISPLPATK